MVRTINNIDNKNSIFEGDLYFKKNMLEVLNISSFRLKVNQNALNADVRDIIGLMISITENDFISSKTLGDRFIDYLLNLDDRINGLWALTRDIYLNKYA